MIEGYEIGRQASGKRMFPLGFQIEFLRQWDECLEWGTKSRLLREHNIHRSMVYAWQRARDRGEWTEAMVAASDRSRSWVDNRDRAELARLRKENEALKTKVAQSEAVQEILGKAFELLDGITKSSTEDPSSAIPPALMTASEYAHWLGRNRLS